MAASGPLLHERRASSAALRRLAYDSSRYPVLLDSAGRGPHGRWTLLAAAPRQALALHASGRVERSDGAAVGAGGFLAALEQCWRSERRTDFTRPASLPFAGGWCVFLGYEVAGEIEPRLRLPRGPEPWQAFALRIPAAILHDAHSGLASVVAEPGEEALAADLVADLDAAIAAGEHCGAAAPAARALAGPLIEEPEEEFLARLARLREAIAAGEIYQANLSRAWRAPLAASFDAVALYERLRAANPAPFAALARWRGLTVLSSSPERLLRLDDGTLSTRPIAGTRPRTAGGGRDVEESAALLAHPKERAEHVMLVDLERSDLGRVCEAGSVRVDELLAVESYAHVHHLVSAVSGRLRPGLSPIAALRALFPGGTITGCPKVRCMELVAREEGVGRGAYTGSLGYIGHDGSADFNILIRSVSIADGVAVLRAGAGIVADSDPARELEETRAKARGLLAAFEVRG